MATELLPDSRSTTTPTDPFAGHGVVLFDGSCQFCQMNIRILRRLDWLKRLRFVPAQERDHWPPCTPSLVEHQLMEEMHVVPPDRQRHLAGFRAFRWIAGRLPLTWLMVPLLYLPGVLPLGNRIYRWIARNRYQLVPCKDGVCTLPKKS
jgi:predicted DCC family thiol-disulfide oxidoreductase YuxK